MRNLILYIWQLPQNLLGYILILWYKPERMYEMENGIQIHYSMKMHGGISLGKYCIVNTGHYRKTLEESLRRNTVRHESVGHTTQSRMLGWLYLVVIGLPSILWVLARRIEYIHDKYDYSWFYTEKWADKIAGIKR